MNWYLSTLKKYAVFRGRAQRKEYWMFFLYNMIIFFLLGVIEAIVGISPELDESILASIYALLLLLPSLAVGVRRLHDIGKSGWWMLLALIPVIGTIILVFFFIKDGDMGTNQYGPNPKWHVA